LASWLQISNRSASGWACAISVRREANPLFKGLLGLLTALRVARSGLEARVGQKGRTGYVWCQRRHTPRGLPDVGCQSAWIIWAVCPARDTGVVLVKTQLYTAAMNLFLAELGQAFAPGAHGIVLADKAGWQSA
jgi:hypothetical protein